jgi:hypothetical protein
MTPTSVQARMQYTILALTPVQAFTNSKRKYTHFGTIHWCVSALAYLQHILVVQHVLQAASLRAVLGAGAPDQRVVEDLRQRRMKTMCRDEVCGAHRHVKVRLSDRSMRRFASRCVRVPECTRPAAGAETAKSLDMIAQPLSRCPFAQQEQFRCSTVQCAPLSSPC